MSEEPIDPDVDLRVPAERVELRPSAWPVVGSISVGGVLGALGRYELQQAFPHAVGQFPWSTFWINLSGCLLIGVLMAFITEVWPNQRLLRPFVGVGILGGYTTFSTYAVDIMQTVAAGAARTALLYLVTTLVGALAAVYVGHALATGAIRRRRAS